MARSYSHWVAGLLVLLAVSPAFAQGRRGGGFGMGGGGARFASPMALVQIDAVQSELGMTEEQKEQVSTIAEEYNTAIRGEGGGRGGFGGGQGNFDPEEFRQRAQEMATRAEEANKKYSPKVAEILDEAQMKRLNQLVVQRQGTMALAENAEVQASLKLTDDQKTKIKEAVDQYQEKIGNISFGQGAFEEMRELGETRDSDLMAVLTDDQKKEFASLKGEEFEFPRGGFGGGRRGGFGGGRRGGGDNN